MTAEGTFPECLKCAEGTLIPLSGGEAEGGARYKAWVCTNPECGFNVRIDDGEISFGRTVSQSYR